MGNLICIQTFAFEAESRLEPSGARVRFTVRDWRYFGWTFAQLFIWHSITRLLVEIVPLDPFPAAIRLLVGLKIPCQDSTFGRA